MSITTKRFTEMVENCEIIEKSGYHQPNDGRPATRCGCQLTTDKGAYRDVIVKDGDVTRYYYHQSEIVTDNGDGSYTVTNCGYKTRTTKQRINQYIPSGYNVFQRDFDWYVSTPDGETVEFVNGMQLYENGGVQND